MRFGWKNETASTSVTRCDTMSRELTVMRLKRARFEEMSVERRGWEGERGRGKEGLAWGVLGKTRKEKGEEGEVEKREGARGGESGKILKRDG
jgi:hypothetical protein